MREIEDIFSLEDGSIVEGSWKYPFWVGFISGVGVCLGFPGRRAYEIERFGCSMALVVSGGKKT